MSHVRRFDDVGITVADLDTVTAFFVGLGLEVEGTGCSWRASFWTLSSASPTPAPRSSCCGRPTEVPGWSCRASSGPTTAGSPAAMANELGLRNVAFEVDDLQAAVDRLAADGYGLVGGIGEYEGIWRMAYVRGPEGIIVSLAERIG